MGVDVLLMSVRQRGTGPKRRQVRPVDVVLDPLDRFSRLCATSRRPVPGRVDPCRTLVLTRADMPQLISELEAELTEHDDQETRGLLDQVLGLARRCEARDAHELHLDGD